MKIASLAILSIVLSTLAQFVLKFGVTAMSAGRTAGTAWSVNGFAGMLGHPAVLAGFVLYGMGALVWLLVLAEWDVSKAYPIVGLGFALTLFVGFLMGEQVSWTRAAGVALICSGVLLVGKS